MCPYLSGNRLGITFPRKAFSNQFPVINNKVEMQSIYFTKFTVICNDIYAYFS